MSEENLNVLFENNFDCYTGFANEELNVEEQMAMTKDKFIEIVTPLMNNLPSPDVEGIYKITDLKRMGFTEIKDLLESQRDVIRICNKRLTDHKNKSPESNKIEEALEHIAYLEGVLSFSDSEIIKKHVVRLGLDRIKSTLKGGE